MSGVTLPAGWHDRPDVVQAGLVVAGLHVLALAWAHDHRTEGWVPRELALTLCSGDDAPIRRAVELGLFVSDVRSGELGYYLPDHDVGEAG